MHRLIAIALFCGVASAGEPIAVRDGTFLIAEARLNSFPADDLADLAGKALREAIAFAATRNSLCVTISIEDFRASERGQTAWIEYRFRLIPKPVPTP